MRSHADAGPPAEAGQGRAGQHRRRPTRWPRGAAGDASRVIQAGL